MRPCTVITRRARGRRLVGACLTSALAAHAAGAQQAAASARTWCDQHNVACQSSYSLFLEEDNMQLRQLEPSTDRNYTLGLGLTRGGAPIAEERHDFALVAAEKALGLVVGHTIGLAFESPGWRHYDRVLNSDAHQKTYSEMVSGTAFTPDSIWDPSVRPGERPYAFLLGWTVRRVTALDDAERVAVSTDLTLGTIGSRLGRNVQRFIHRTVRGRTNCDATGRGKGPCDPKGWGNQIMDVASLWGGQPTARYGALAEWRLFPTWIDEHRDLAARASGVRYIEPVVGLGGEAGYYTNAYASARFRVGYFTGPFYSWWQAPLAVASKRAAVMPDTGGHFRYAMSVAPPPRFEGFVYGGVRGRAWAYNALLQGYPGYKGYAFPRDSVQTFTDEGELGSTVAWRPDMRRRWTVQLTYELLGGRSHEFLSSREKPHYWGGVFFTLVHVWGD